MWRHPVTVLHRTLRNLNKKETGDVIGVIIPQVRKPIKVPVGQSVAIFSVKQNNDPNGYDKTIGFKDYGKVINNVVVTDVKFNETSETTNHMTMLQFNKPDTYDMIFEYGDEGKYDVKIIVD